MQYYSIKESYIKTINECNLTSLKAIESDYKDSRMSRLQRSLHTWLSNGLAHQSYVKTLHNYWEYRLNAESETQLIRI
jgi:hypothetical protein